MCNIVRCWCFLLFTYSWVFFKVHKMQNLWGEPCRFPKIAANIIQAARTTFHSETNQTWRRLCQNSEWSNTTKIRRGRLWNCRCICSASDYIMHNQVFNAFSRPLQNQLNANEFVNTGVRPSEADWHNCVKVQPRSQPVLTAIFFPIGLGGVCSIFALHLFRCTACVVAYLWADSGRFSNWLSKRGSEWSRRPPSERSPSRRWAAACWRPEARARAYTTNGTHTTRRSRRFGLFVY